MKLTLLGGGIHRSLECAVWPGGVLWIAKFEFRGKALLITLIDLPFSVSPVGGFDVRRPVRSAGLEWWLREHEIKIILPSGIVLATIFVTFPFVARELIPVMQAAGMMTSRAVSRRANGWTRSGMSRCPA